MLKSDFENLKILVFDLDGTLVQSNQLKEQIFFDIFDTKFHPIIANVLNKYKHASRFEVIDKILIETSNSFSDRDLNQLTSAYSNHLIEKIQNSYKISNIEFYISAKDGEELLRRTGIDVPEKSHLICPLILDWWNMKKYRFLGFEMCYYGRYGDEADFEEQIKSIPPPPPNKNLSVAELIR